MTAEHSSPEPNRRTLLASVVFADIVGYSKSVVAQQIDLKTKFNAMINRSIEHVTKADRMILDTGDGAAICFLGDPEDALIAATNLAAAAHGTDVSLRLGINLGPVKIVKDVNGRPNVLGDGINDAQRVMSFSEPSQILVSRSYYEVLSRLSQEYSRLFSYVGVHKDKHVREHEVYLVTQPGDAVATAEATEPAAVPEPEASIPTVALKPVLETEFVPASPAIAAAASAHSFEPAVLARIETALARSLGPLARVIVSRAAQSATDLAHLYRTVAASIPESKQKEFARDLGDLVNQLAPAAAPASAPPAAAAPKELPAEVLAKASERLALYLGPVAKMIVKKTAAQATSPRDLYERLAQQIDDPKSRERFLASA